MATLLLIDDDEDLSESLADLLKMQGHVVDLAADGTVATNCLGSKQYDLVLLDWQLPDMPGVEVCRQYRDKGGKALILMMSGMRDAESKESGMAAGATSFLTKPFTVDQLLERLQNMLQSPTPRD